MVPVSRWLSSTRGSGLVSVLKQTFYVKIWIWAPLATLCGSGADQWSPHVDRLYVLDSPESLPSLPLSFTGPPGPWSHLCM